MTITNYSGLPIKFAEDLLLDTLPPLSAFQYLLDDMTCIRRGVKCSHTNQASCWLETVSEVRGRKETPHFVVPRALIPDSYISRITVTGIPEESYDAWMKTLPACVKNFSSKCPTPFAPSVTNGSTTAATVVPQPIPSVSRPSRPRGSNKSRVVRIRGRSVRIQPYHEKHSPPSSLDEYVIDRSTLPIAHLRRRTNNIIIKHDGIPPPVAPPSDNNHDSVPEHLLQMIDEQRVAIDMLQKEVEHADSKRRRLQRSVNTILEALNARGFLQADE